MRLSYPHHRSSLLQVLSLVLMLAASLLQAHEFEYREFGQSQQLLHVPQSAEHIRLRKCALSKV